MTRRTAVLILATSAALGFAAGYAAWWAGVAAGYAVSHVLTGAGRRDRD